MLERISQDKFDIPVSEMKDGQIAVITTWSVAHTFSGRIVQRHGANLITIGRGRGHSWTGLFSRPRPSNKDRVQLLQEGELLRIIDN